MEMKATAQIDNTSDSSNLATSQGQAPSDLIDGGDESNSSDAPAADQSAGDATATPASHTSPEDTTDPTADNSPSGFIDPNADQPSAEDSAEPTAEQPSAEDTNEVIKEDTSADETSTDESSDATTKDSGEDVASTTTDEDSDETQAISPDNSLAERFISRRALSTTLDGCISLDANIDVTGGLQGTLKPFFDEAGTFSIFSKEAELFKACLTSIHLSRCELISVFSSF